MTADSILYRDLAYVFGAAVLGGLIARKVRQPLILGYVAGGILISPFTPGPSVSDVRSLELFAEIGVILLMFTIGLEFHVKDLLKVKWVAILGGAMGILGSMGFGVAVGRLMGWSTTQGLVIGAIISVASTMVLARFLLDRGELRTERGRVMIGITLVEDLAVVILTVVLPSLALSGTDVFAAVGSAVLKAALLLVPLGIAGAKLVPPLLRRVMGVHSQELFLLVLLALCLGTAAITQAIGLSLALGAFVAGLVLSGSDYAREALGNLFPLRDAFVALFFVTVGMLIEPGTLLSNLHLLAVLIAMIVAGKALIWTLVVRLFGYPFWTAAGVALGLTQIGEFSFILVQVARGADLVGADVYNATLAASLVSILINAMIWRYGMPLIDGRRALSYAVDVGEAPQLEGHIVICGFGRLGAPAGAALQAFGVPYVIIEIDPQVVRAARGRNLHCLFGDPSRGAVLEAAHTGRASLVLVTLPEPDRAYLTIRNVRALNPNAPVLARAHRRNDYELLKQAGATRVVQPETEAAATLIGETLEISGIPEGQVLAYLSRYREAMELATPRLIGKPYLLPELREIPVEKIGAGGRRLRESGIRERYGISVVRVRRRSGENILNPGPDTLLLEGDVLQVLGIEEELDKIGARSPALT
jgi:CPA2 family monovalent cation:H+ antiporter-2